jgi:hypothetical protein
MLYLSLNLKIINKIPFANPLCIAKIYERAFTRMPLQEELIHLSKSWQVKDPMKSQVIIKSYLFSQHFFYKKPQI